MPALAEMLVVLFMARRQSALHDTVFQLVPRLAAADERPHAESSMRFQLVFCSSIAASFP